MINKTIIVTGGAGFIGSNLIRHLIKNTEHTIINLDKLTYAGSLLSLKDIEDNKRYKFERTDLCDQSEVDRVITKYDPDYIMHLAAESHVDRSISGPEAFILSNILGTYYLLDASLKHYKTLNEVRQKEFRFLHVSTDEVFGSLGREGYFTESTPYDPRSPYSASKASADHLVRAWSNTYGLPTLITNCSNNYGPYQFPEKLIPVIIINALNGKNIPIYGKGDNIRDWLHVEDHVRALRMVLEKGKIGDSYNIGGNNEKSNIEIVEMVCSLLDKHQPLTTGSYQDLITFVSDRPGHDKRYAIDAAKIRTELGFNPSYSFEQGLEQTVLWYLNNFEWTNQVIEDKITLARSA